MIGSKAVGYIIESREDPIASESSFSSWQSWNISILQKVYEKVKPKDFVQNVLKFICLVFVASMYYEKTMHWFQNYFDPDLSKFHFPWSFKSTLVEL